MEWLDRAFYDWDTAQVAQAVKNRDIITENRFGYKWDDLTIR